MFFGSCNDHEFLKDGTGNRRFWPIDVGVQESSKSVWDDLPDEIDMIWAEAVERFRQGEALYLDEQGISKTAQDAQSGHRQVSIREGLIQDFVKKPVPQDFHAMKLSARRLFWAGSFEDKGDLVPRDRVCALEVWCECLDGDPKMMRRSDAKEINQILAEIPGAIRAKTALRFGYCGVQRGFLLQEPLE